MKETYGGKQSAEWYAKGAKSVEVGLRLSPVIECPESSVADGMSGQVGTTARFP
jgi:hypothetical protein